ncbi:PAS-domain containing protein [Acidisphaera sp. S103]|uniref:PAS-domain containing protein n=1 Tax=Acidisphaera sp. S103 TaxID=1747223 RepID=UPI00131D82A2|nr:PAS-domain containing protein [Acidisphaera sp. S103]
MSDKFKRRRRRTGSTSARFKPSQLIPVESVRSARIGRAELAACGAVGIVAVALIALIWIVTMRAVQEQRTEILDRAEQTMVGQAAAMSETIGHELTMIDQSLVILQAAWKADSKSFDLNAWQKQMPALTAVADDLFICDDKHIIRQDILPAAIGQGVGAAYVTFPHGSLEQFQSDGTQDKESLLLQGGGVGEPIDARQFLMYIVRPLDHPKGWLIGASYRSTELTKLFAQAALGFDPVVALVDTRRGVVQAIVGPAARRPKMDMSKSPLFDVMTRSQSGTWIGSTAIDGVERLHAFHQVAGRDMVVLVAASLAEVMTPAENLTAGARALAFVASALVLAIGGLVLWELYTIRGQNRQKRIFNRIRSELDRLRTEEAGNTARARLNAVRLQVVLDSVVDGIALFDSSLRLVQWNHPFLRGIGIEPRKDMPLDALLREQAAKGLFGPLDDVEAEIGRRSGILRTGDVTGLPQPGPDDETLILRGMLIAEGGFILVLNGITTWEPAPRPAASTELDEPAAPEIINPAPIEW